MRHPRIILILILLFSCTGFLFVPYADSHKFYFTFLLAPDAHNDAGYYSDTTSLILKDLVFDKAEGFWVAYALFFPIVILCASFFSKYLHHYISTALVIIATLAAMLCTLFTLVDMDLSNMFDKMNYHWNCYVLIGMEIFFEVMSLLLLTKWFSPLRKKILQ